MALDGKCPRCAFKAPILSFFQESTDSRVCVAVVKLPPQVQAIYFPYLSLFRPKSGCAVQSAKAERLTNELNDLVSKEYVSERGQVDRPCTPRIWAMAIEKMLEQAGSLTLPMKSHGYLKTIAWDLANKEDAGREQQIRTNEAQGQRPKGEERPRPSGVDPLEKARQAWDEKHGTPSGEPGAIALPEIKGMD